MKRRSIKILISVIMCGLFMGSLTYGIHSEGVEGQTITQMQEMETEETEREETERMETATEESEPEETEMEETETAASESEETEPEETEAEETEPEETESEESEPEETEMEETETAASEPEESETVATEMEETEPEETETAEAETTESESVETETEEKETEAATEPEIMDTDMISTYIADRAPSGTTVVGASGWSRADNIDRMDYRYYPVRFYEGISWMEGFCTSSKVTRVSENGTEHYYPRTGDEEGKFGAIYHKVLFYDNQWYDLKMTVEKYSKQVRCDGGDKITAYPFIEFYTQKIRLNFHEALGEFLLKCEFLNSDTGAVTKLNTRFQWKDIDSAQRYGLKLVDGSVAAKYYYGDSRIHYQTGQTVAGLSGLEMVIGASENHAESDMKNAVVYEMQQCSTYYMAIGFRDHLEDDDNSLSKTKIQTWSEELADGNYTGTRSYLSQTDTEMNIIQTPAPEKWAANEGGSWTKENLLPTIRSEYLYKIEQFVPWQSADAHYESFVIKDTLPAGISYVGNIQIIRIEDQKDVTGWFLVSAEKNVITAAAKSDTRAADDFYGYHYRITFRVKMKPEEAEAVYSGNQVVFSASNQAVVSVKHSLEMNFSEVRSEAVHTKAALYRNEQESPVKGFAFQAQQTEKILVNREDEIVFSIFQSVPVNEVFFRPSVIEMTDTLESCLWFQGMSVKWRAGNSDQWQDVSGWSVEQNGQKVTARGLCKEEYEGGMLLWQIRCRLKKNVDLSRWEKTQGAEEWSEIPNRAAVTFTWEKGEVKSVTRETNTVVVKLKEMVIRLKKEILAEDIVWAHGDPVFSFRVEGTDLNGKYHVWYETVTFTRDGISKEGKITANAEFRVPAGVYLASELPVIRYRLKEIHSITGGTADGERVLFDLSTTPEGTAVFYNEKVTDEDESDTCFVRNQIGI